MSDGGGSFNRTHSSWGLKPERVVALRMCAGIEIQTSGAWYWKDLWPNVFVLTPGTVRSFSSLDVREREVWYFAEMKDMAEKSRWNDGKRKWLALNLTCSQWISDRREVTWSFVDFRKTSLAEDGVRFAYSRFAYSLMLPLPKVASWVTQCSVPPTHKTRFAYELNGLKNQVLKNLWNGGEVRLRALRWSVIRISV